MPQIILGPNRAYPALPTVGDDLESHRRAIEAIVECIQIHERRTNDVLDSFVRVGELETLGIVEIDGKVVSDVATEESTTHHHDSTYLRLDGTNDPVTGSVSFSGGLSATGLTAGGAVDFTGATGIDVTGVPFTGLSSDDLSDVASIAMLDEAEIVLGAWTFNENVTIDTADLIITDGTRDITLDAGDIVSTYHGLWLNQITETSSNYVLLGDSSSNTYVNAANIMYVRINNSTIMQIDSNSVNIRGGNTFRVQDSGGTDSINFSHDGTDANTTFTATTDWNISSASFYKFDNDVSSSGGAFFTRGPLSNDGIAGQFTFIDQQASYGRLGSYSWTTAQYEPLYIVGEEVRVYTGTAGTTNLAIFDSNSLNIRGGNALEIYDSLNTDYLAMSHNGTDFTFNFINTGAWHILNLTSAYFRDGASVRIYDSGDTDYANLSHDGTDFTINGVNTVDFVFSGITGFYDFSTDLHTNGGYQATGGVKTTGVNEQMVFLDVSGGRGRLGSYNWGTASYQPILIEGNNVRINTRGDDFELYNAGVLLSLLDTSLARWDLFALDFRIRDGKALTIWDPTDSDNMSFSHDGTDFNIAATNTAEVNFTGATVYNFDDEVRAVGGIVARTGSWNMAYDSTNTDYIYMYHNGTHGYLKTDPGSGGSIFLEPATGSVGVITGFPLRIYDSTNVDYAEFRHDGTDFRTDFVTTANWLISGGVVIDQGNNLFVRDAGQTDYLQLFHDGADAVVRGQNTDAINFEQTAGDGIVFENQTLDHWVGAEGADAVRAMLWPQGGELSIDTAAQVGAPRIRLSGDHSNSMIWLRISGYNYSPTVGGPWEVLVGGYCYVTGQNWVNTGAYTIAGAPPFEIVKFMTGAANEAYIQLGEVTDTHEYPQLEIKEVTIGYGSHASQTRTGWTVTLATTETGITTDNYHYVWGFQARDAGGYMRIENAAASGLALMDGQGFLIYDSTNVDYTQMYHSGSLGVFNESTGVGMDFQLGGGLEFFIRPNWIGSTTPYKILERAAAESDSVSYGQLWVQNTTPPKFKYTDDVGNDFDVQGHGIDFRIYEAAGVDYGAFSHDGTNLQVNFSGTGAFSVRSGVYLQVRDSTNTDTFDLRETGSTSQLVSNNNPIAVYPAGTKACEFNPTHLETKPIFISEAASAAADIATWGQFWVRNFAPNLPYFTTDTGEDRFLTHEDEMEFAFDTATTGVDPGAGDIRLNSATPASVTNFYVSTTGRDGRLYDWRLDNVAVGDILYFKNAISQDHFFVGKVASIVVNATWVSIACTTMYYYGTAVPAAGDPCRLWFDSLSKGTIPAGSVDNAVTTYDTVSGTWVENPTLRSDPATGETRFYQVGTGDYVEFTHDGNDLNVTSVNTATFAFLDLHVELGDVINLQFGTGGDVRMNWDSVDMEITALVANPVWNWRDGAKFKFWDSTDVDAAQIYHDGANLHVSGTDGTTGALVLDDGLDFDMYDPAGTDLFRIVNDGTSVSFISTGISNYQFQDAGEVRVYNTGDTDYISLQHDGTNAQIQFDSLTDRLEIGTSSSGFDELRVGGVLTMVERPAAHTSLAAHGQLWVKNDVPNNLYFTDDAGGHHPVAYAKLNNVSEDAADVIDWQYMNGIAFKDGSVGVTYTLEASGVTTFEVGATCQFINAHATTGDITINEGASTTLYLLTGAAVTDTAGGCTLAPGGYATVYRHSATVYYVFGAGLTA